jgi:hypothetical protein
MISLDSSRVSLLVCRANGTLGEGIVGANLALLSAPEPAILCAHPGDPLSRSEAVQLHGFAEVPPGVLAIGQELAARLDLDRPNAAWHLGASSVTVVRAEVVELELTVDAPVVAIADALSAQGQLAGRLLYVSSAQQLGALSLTVGDDEYRVRYVRPAPVPDTDTLYQLDASTEVQLSSSGIRSPVDIVVLSVKLWDTGTGREVATLRVKGEVLTNPVAALAFSIAARNSSTEVACSTSAPSEDALAARSTGRTSPSSCPESPSR